jgi:hypothetical protein
MFMVPIRLVRVDFEHECESAVLAVSTPLISYGVMHVDRSSAILYRETIYRSDDD